MLRPRRQYRMLQAAFVFALVGGAFFGAYAGMRASVYQHTHPAKHGSQDIDYLSALWLWITHDATGFFTIILCFITGALAVATYLLYLTTTDIARDTKEASDTARMASAAALLASTKATDLAREEFNATHRPELAAREVHWGERNNSIALTIVNRGTSPCTILESDFHFRGGNPEGRALRTNGTNRIGRIEIPAGAFHDYAYPLGSADEAADAGFATEHVAARGHALGQIDTGFFQGTILYEDEAKVRRRLVILRMSRAGRIRFSRSDNPEDEYTD